MARKGIFSSTPTPPQPPADTPPREVAKPVRGAVGALQSSLTRLQESAVQEIDTALIDDAGFEDRLGVDPEAQKQLQESLKTYGQQVPVLLRPHPARTGRYEIVFGRRRLAALRALRMPVKAMVRQLDDHALVMAQGQENTARQELSFIEKASFSAQLKAAGYERQTIADALSIDLPMLSRMLKVGESFDLEFLKKIGSAPGIGRDRWMALARLIADPAARSRAVRETTVPAFTSLSSDDRFDAVFRRATAPRQTAATQAQTPKARTLRSTDGVTLGDVRQGRKGVTITVSARTAEGFDSWLDQNAEGVMQELYDRWKEERS